MRVGVGVIDLGLVRCGCGSCHKVVFMDAKECGEPQVECRVKKRVENLHFILKDAMGGHGARMLRVRARGT